MIDVVLQRQIAAANLLQNVQGLARGGEIEAGNIPGVDHLHDQPNARCLQFVRSELEVVDECLFGQPGAGTRYGNPRQAVDLGVAQHFGVGNGQIDPGTKLLDPIRVAGDAAFAVGPIAGR